ncbi:DUF2066 domain-containing protein [Vibrio marisflavi]|uniref:DUF2066 domain-containing protein n=1 Tax=Vibrio marisflavi CECT 7928 TaxID=634439 RepID=A0ABN8E3H3_9VIBR|nr:DUF2066 domain-containing protein [Vibrio marisflavi]CAH0539089.1 hypothetical protein VMF7928_01887 [Vibrio marisflavi CECT 7928]
MRNLVLLVMMLLALPAYALTKVDLYSSQVLLGKDAKDAKVADSNARVQGMKNVIIRASGDPNAASNEIIAKALNNSSRYITQISYSTEDQNTYLDMMFGAPQIRSLLTQAQLPFWPSMRPNILLWVIEDNGYERQIDWEHSNSPVLKEIRETAQQRGLPLTVPVGDFDDITGTSASDFWGGFVIPMSKASQRYPADAVLVVKVEQGGRLSWTLYDQKPASMIDTTAVPVTGSDSGDDAGTQMVNEISNYYAKKSGVVIASESSESVKTQFTNINTAQDFFKLEEKLKGLTSVASLDVLSIQGTTVMFRVHLLAPVDSFEQEVSRMGGVTKIDADDLQQPADGSLDPNSPVSVDPASPASTGGESSSQIDTQNSSSSELSDNQYVVDTTADSTEKALSNDGSVVPVQPVNRVLAYKWQN